MTLETNIVSLPWESRWEEGNRLLRLLVNYEAVAKGFCVIATRRGRERTALSPLSLWERGWG